MKYGILSAGSPNDRLLPLCDESFTVSMKQGLAFRVYADSQPHNLKISSLQKGLVLVINGRELIEEGAGFGVPVAIFSDRTCFSSLAQVFISKDEQNKIIVKRFLINTFSRRKWKIGAFVDNPFYKSVSSLLEESYRNNPGTRKIIIPLMGLKNKVGVKTDFIKSKPRGEVTITYRIKPNQLDVEVDFSSLNKTGLKKLVMLNEQGSTFFRRLVMPDGSELTDERIGSWNPVNASNASFSDVENSFSFCLHNLPNSRLFVGREYFKGLTAWAGMEYEVEPSLNQFSYVIQFD